MIGLENLQIRCRIGVTEQERAEEQLLGLDIQLQHDLCKAGASDNLEDTIDYALLAELCHRVATEREYCLLERLATCMIEEILKVYQPTEIRVKLKKRGVIPFADFAFVEIVRRIEN